MNGSSLQYQQVDIGSSGDNTLVVAVTDRQILVASLVLIPAGEVDLVFKSDTTEVLDLGGFRGTDEPSGLALSFNPHGYFQTNSGEALVLNLDGAVAVRGFLNYWVR